MNTVIIIVTPLGLENSIPEIKAKIAEYIGKRLIAENSDTTPMMVLNNTLDTFDKEQIGNIANNILETSAVLLIETDDEKFHHTCESIITLVPKLNNG